MKVSRLLQTRGVENARDLGGMTNREGRKIREGLLIRSAALDRATAEDMALLYDEIGIRTVFDLRSFFEAQETPDRLAEGVEYVSNEIASDEAFGVKRDVETKKQLDELLERMKAGGDEAAAEYMCFFYASFARSEFSLSQYGRLLKRIMASDSPVLWHCAMGKDRCGIATALIREMLEGDRETIAEDYMYTNEVYGIDESFNAFERADRRYIETFYSEAEKRHGSVEGMFEKMGIDKNMIEAFRNRVLD